MFYLPTTKDGMNAAIGHYIHNFLAAKMAADNAAHTAKVAAPGYKPTPFVWDVKTAPKPKKTDAEVFADYCAAIRARKS